MRILIDGYNLIFQCGLQGRVAGSFALEKARRRLISELTSRLDDASRSETTIVFDAKNRPIKEVVDEERINKMSIVYAVGHDDADSLIEELIRKHSTPKKLVVVSSDHRIHDAARRRKAKPIDSDIWYEQIENEARSSASKKVSSNDKPELGDYNPFPPGYGEDLTERKE